MLKVPSGFAVVLAAIELSGLYKRIVTNLLANTCPVSVADAGTVVGVANPFMVRVVGMDNIFSRIPCPLETRAVHSTIV